jgi:tRNA (guanine-N7-)-methyltransferase
MQHPTQVENISPDAEQSRHIRSFVVRAGRMSDAQKRSIEQWLPVHGISYQKEQMSLSKLFVKDQPTVLEIGFGMGITTVEIAKTLAHNNFIGIEVHPPGVGNCLKLIEADQLQNLKIIQHDAVEVLRDMIPDASLHAIHIFFPDPWHKARHQKRRLIQPEFVKVLCSKLQAGGYLHLATDWENYAEQMLEVLSAEPTLQNTASGYAPKPDYRPTTKFETRGLKLGHGVWDLVFKKK